MPVLAPVTTTLAPLRDSGKRMWSTESKDTIILFQSMKVWVLFSWKIIIVIRNNNNVWIKLELRSTFFLFFLHFLYKVHFPYCNTEHSVSVFWNQHCVRAHRLRPYHLIKRRTSDALKESSLTNQTTVTSCGWAAEWLNYNFLLQNVKVPFIILCRLNQESIKSHYRPVVPLYLRDKYRVISTCMSLSDNFVIWSQFI